MDHILLPSGAPSCLSCTNFLEEPLPSRTNRYARPGELGLESAQSNTSSLPFSKTIPSLPSIYISPDPAISKSAAIAIQVKRQTMEDLVSLAKQCQNLPTSIARFGSIKPCPACNVKVAPMEAGTLLGPDNQTWHQSCLRCGKGSETQGLKGCSKQLDSRAIVRDGILLCRQCSVGSPPLE